MPSFFIDPFLLVSVLPMLVGWVADILLGDPPSWPHPVVWMGKAIAFCEHRFNKPPHQFRNGAFTAFGLIVSVFLLVFFVVRLLSPFPIACAAFVVVGVFFCLAGCTLRREVSMVFQALDVSLEKGRTQVGRIVGRDTGSLSAQEVRTAALETLAENLSDGVVAPLFWFALLGLPGMVTYKMVNTLDSMIGYRNERFKAFGCCAARIDDFANFIPARLSAFLLLLAAGRLDLIRFVWRFGPQHASPNSGWPEAALAGILNCRFGGTHDYFGTAVYKPFIGENDRQLSTADMRLSISVAMRAEVIMVILTIAVLLLESLCL